MNKEVSLDDLMPLILEKLENGGSVTFTPKGRSMLPMLRNGEDVVVLSKPEGRLKLFDLPLYKRENGAYVLHRVVGFDKDGGYVMCGDNQYQHEHGIKDENIIAVVKAFHRKGKPYTVDSPSYRLYVNFWYYTSIFRRIYLAGRAKAAAYASVRKKIIKKKK